MHTQTKQLKQFKSLMAASFSLAQSLPRSRLTVADDAAFLSKSASMHGLAYGLRGFVSEGNEGVSSQSKKPLYKQLLANQLHQKQTQELTRLLIDNNVEHVFIKGSALVSQCYPNTHFARNAIDLDVLVNSHDIPRVCDCLIKQGYQYREQGDQKVADFVGRYPGWFRYRDIGFKHPSKGRLNIDLHWRLMDEFTLPLSTRTVLANAEQVSVGGVLVCVPSFEHHVIFVCLHAYIDHFFMAKQWVDIYAASIHPRFEARKILAMAGDLGVARQLQTVFDALDGLLAPSQEASVYTQQVWQRYVDNAFVPKRSHPNKQRWTRNDKREYLQHQQQYKSRRASVLSPVVARLKYNRTMVLNRPKIHPLLWYPLALMSRWRQVFFGKKS